MYQDGGGKLWRRTSPEIQKRARELRQQMTGAEAKLWERLRRDGVGGLRFRRQHPFGPYIFDFFCRELNLVIEVDGNVHTDSLQKENDLERDEQCRAQGLTVLRFTNEQILNDLDHVLQTILTLSRSQKG
ncbi:MAG: endonuclease domain-containing protein [Ardenticatenales bacterium]|nr:endonuclease domain-containing protein [Ardenticatenales bacterium]